MTREHFKKIRKDKGYTQVELAKLFDITVVYISKLENGHSKISPIMAMAMLNLPRKS